jgi:hypothetical protein
MEFLFLTRGQHTLATTSSDPKTVTHAFEEPRFANLPLLKESASVVTFNGGEATKLIAD